jgi:hypothetical protein
MNEMKHRMKESNSKSNRAFPLYPLYMVVLCEYCVYTSYKLLRFCEMSTRLID